MNYTKHVNQNGLVLQYVPQKFKTMELCLTAVLETFWVYEYIPDQYKI